MDQAPSCNLPQPESQLSSNSTTKTILIGLNLLVILLLDVWILRKRVFHT